MFGANSLLPNPTGAREEPRTLTAALIEAQTQLLVRMLHLVNRVRCLKRAMSHVETGSSGSH
eukprot:2163209-Amphidinium_carterae.1